MPSPFPGMNPYFEQAAHWLDFHSEFLSSLRRLLAPQLAPKYIVQLEEHIYIHDLPSEPRQRLGTADLSLVEPGSGELPGRARPSRSTGGGLASRAGRRESAVPGSPGPPGPGAGDRDRALEPVEQASRRRPRAVPRQASRTAAEPGPPRRDRPACADGLPCPRKTGPSATTRCWSAGPRSGGPPISGPSVFATGCRSSPSRSGPPDAAARVDLQEVLHRAYDGPGYEHFIYRGEPEPSLAGERCGLGTAVRAGKNFSLSRLLAANARKSGWLSFFRDVEYSKPGRRHRSKVLGT